MSPPTIGELRDEIVLEQQIRTATAGGGATLSWFPLGPLWAAIRPLSGRETVIADQIVSLCQSRDLDPPSRRHDGRHAVPPG